MKIAKEIELEDSTKCEGCPCYEDECWCKLYGTHSRGRLDICIKENGE